MKKNLLVIGLMAAGVVGANAQAVLDFDNNNSAADVSHIYGPETQNPQLQLSGNVSTAYVANGAGANHRGEFPTGTQVYNGGIVGGESTGTGTYQQANGLMYSVELAAVSGSGAATVGTANFIPTSLTTIETLHSTKGVSGNAGFFNAGPVVIPGTAGDAAQGTGPNSATAQVFSWFNGGSAGLTYAQSVAAGDPAGFSAVFNVLGLADPNNAAQTAPELANLTSFNLTQVPEPSTIVLGVIGASSFLLRRRK